LRQLHIEFEQILYNSILKASLLDLLAYM